MKISNDSLMGNIVEGKYNTAVSDMTKALMQLKSGDVFSGTVVDIKQNSVTIKLDDNSVFNAKSMGSPDLRIGERASFNVKENNSGQILVEISKTGEETANFVKELLNNAEMPLTKENIELVKFLIENNMPIDKKTLSDALFFKYTNEFIEKENGVVQNPEGKEVSLNGGESSLLNISDKSGEKSTGGVLEKVLFLLNEKMPADKVTVETLNRLIENSSSLKTEISSMASEISKMPDNELKQKLLEILDIDKNKVFSKKELETVILKKLMFNENDIKTKEALTAKFEKIFEIVSKSGEAASKMADKLPNDIIKQNFDNIKNDLSFMKEIDNYKEYIQVPININGREAECEMHIFKNPKGKKNYSQRASVLLCLDYFYIGKIDAFIEKTDKNLAFQFKCDKKNTISLIKKNINKLSDALENYGFKITNVSYKERDESFNITKNKNGNNKNVSSKRYSFDMRV